MKKSKLSAKGLRMILIVLIFAIIGLSVTGFYFAQKWLLYQATLISQTVAESNSSNNNLKDTQQLQKELAAQQAVSAKADALRADPQTYQNKSITDINTYAKAAGIQISNYSFAQTASAGEAAARTSPITATLSSPTSYQGLLKFMSYIESNVPKMQVSSLNLGRIDGGSSDTVRIDQITIEVYIQ
jgi:hypothetical protein